MNNDSHKRNIILGIFWSLAGRIGYLVIALLANIILVSILSPYEFGQVGIVMFFIIIDKKLTALKRLDVLLNLSAIIEKNYLNLSVLNFFSFSKLSKFTLNGITFFISKTIFGNVCENTMGWLHLFVKTRIFLQFITHKITFSYHGC